MFCNGDEDQQHEDHEAEDGGGYPRGTRDVGELAGLVRRVDVYTAKLAAREHRAALAADVAGRQMFMSEPGHPMVAALVKELGIRPPGSFVRLASGAVGVVAERHGVSRAQVALAWVRQQGPVTAPIIGATKPEHLDDALESLELALEPDDIDLLETPYTPRNPEGYQ